MLIWIWSIHSNMLICANWGSSITCTRFLLVAELLEMNALQHEEKVSQHMTLWQRTQKLTKKIHAHTLH